MEGWFANLSSIDKIEERGFNLEDIHLSLGFKGI